MTLLIQVVPDHRPQAKPLPDLPMSAPSQPMLELTPPIDEVPLPAADEQAHNLANRLAHVLVEVLSGRRPVGQLDRWAIDTVLVDLARTMRRRHPPRLRVASVHCQRPHSDVLEVSIRFVGSGLTTRSGAIAAQLRRRGRRWVCEAVELGPEFRTSSRDTS